MRKLLCLTLLAALVMAVPTAQPTGFTDAHEAPPSGWTGPVFKLSQDYPTTRPAAEPRPWKSFNFRTQPEQYLKAVLQYCYEGNIEANWDGSANTVRKWYHAPWLHPGIKGREFMHGMTRERSARPRRLHPAQTDTIGAYAVGMYNAPGGWTMGRVWADHDDPDPSKANFPEGTVAVKLLFVEVPEARAGNSGLPAARHLDNQVPTLKNSFEWEGFVSSDGQFGTNTRANGRVRLIQIDVAVKDDRAAATTGWVYGTFNYSAAATGTRPWDRMLPVGLTWGNDPSLTPANYRAGSRPLQSKVFPANITTNPVEWKGLGWGERLNGPIDNPASACLSCHMTAQIPSISDMFSSALPFRTVNDPAEILDPQVVATKMRWFRNIKRQPFDSGGFSLDYSLQLQDGIDNWCEAVGCNTR